MAALLRLAVAALAAFSALALPDACGCGLPGNACCNCEFRPLDDKCLFNLGSRWCDDRSSCDGRLCVADVADQSSEACGGQGDRCCEGLCDDVAFLCASGTCVDPAGVLEQSNCGVDGAPCCGYYEDCDENLTCVSKVCQDAPGA